MNFLKFLVFAFLVICSTSSYAACANPVGEEADMFYNTTYKAVQFCNGTNWVNMVTSSVSGGSSAIPSGAVMSFNLATCPAGWNEYTLARGRFIRGIDSTGTNDTVRVAGNVQADELKSHNHESAPYMPASGSVNWAPFGTTATRWDGSYAGQSVGNAALSSSTGGTETRPKNVALLYCEKI